MTELSSWHNTLDIRIFTFSSGLGSSKLLCYIKIFKSFLFYLICLGKTTKTKPKILLFFFLVLAEQAELNRTIFLTAQKDKQAWTEIFGGLFDLIHRILRLFSSLSFPSLPSALLSTRRLSIRIPIPTPHSLAIAAFPCASVTIVLFPTTTITGRTKSRETDAEKEKKSTRERERACPVCCCKQFKAGSNGDGRTRRGRE
jgi:hypothetical protein